MPIGAVVATSALRFGAIVRCAGRLAFAEAWSGPTQRSSSGDVGHDLGGEALHLLGLIEDGVEQDHLGAGLGHLAQSLLCRRPVYPVTATGSSLRPKSP